MRIEKFEELEAWKESRKLVNLVFDATESGAFANVRGLRDQMQRAAISVLSNVAEGFHAGSNAEFARFLRYARRSVAELQSQVYIAADRKLISRNTCNGIYGQATRTAKVVNGLKRYLLQRPKPSADKST